MSPWVRWASRLHRRIVHFFPHEFQVRHGIDLEQTGDDAAGYLWRRYGVFGLLRMLGDAVMWMIVEHLAEFGRNLRYSARRLTASPGYAAIGVLSLALSVGMCSLFFVQIKNVTGPAAGIQSPQALVSPERPVSFPDFERYREHADIFSASAAFIGPTPFIVRAGGDANRQRIFGHLVTPDYFAALGVHPAAGRLFDPVTDKPGGENPVVITHRMWQGQFAGAADTVGQSIQINGRPAVIVGISEEGFRGVFPLTPVELFVPTTVGDAVAPELHGDTMSNPDANAFRALFRLADGVSLEQAEAALAVTAKVLDERLAKPDRPREERTLSLLEAGSQTPLNRTQRNSMYGLNFVILGMILAMACTNLAILLFARSGERRKEVAIRLSVGAGRMQVVREVITESVVLALAGGAVGVLVSYWLLRWQGTMEFRSNVPFEISQDFGWSVVLFAAVISVVAGVAIGVAPAFSAIRGDLVGSLKQGGEGKLRGFSRFGIRNQFMLFQLAGSLTLLMVTAFTVWGYQSSYNIDLGFATDNVYLAALDPVRDGYAPSEAAKLLEEVPEQLATLPEIESVALARNAPYSQPMVVPQWRVSIPGDNQPRDGAAGDDAPDTLHTVVRQEIGASYFTALGVPILRGREFARTDQTDPEQQEVPAILNQKAAETLFSGGNALGRVLHHLEERYVIVGIAQNTAAGLMASQPAATVFLPLSTESFASGGPAGTTLFLRGLPGSAPLPKAVSHLLSREPNLMVFNQRSLASDLDQFKVLLRWTSMMNGSLGAFGLMLSVIGLFGITAHSVARRRKEIGIRVALGAQRSNVLRLVLREAGALVVLGGLLGFAGAYLLSRVFSASASQMAEVFAVGANDPLLVFGAPLLWGALALFACYLPARRSLRIDPSLTLRAE